VNVEQISEFIFPFLLNLSVPPNEITVDRVHPLHGPLAGGTRVTVTGHLLTKFIVSTVYIGGSRLSVHANR